MRPRAFNWSSGMVITCSRLKWAYEELRCCITWCRGNIRSRRNGPRYLDCKANMISELRSARQMRSVSSSRWVVTLPPAVSSVSDRIHINQSVIVESNARSRAERSVRQREDQIACADPLRQLPMPESMTGCAISGVEVMEMRIAEGTNHSQSSSQASPMPSMLATTAPPMIPTINHLRVPVKP